MLCCLQAPVRWITAQQQRSIICSYQSNHHFDTDTYCVLPANGLVVDFLCLRVSACVCVALVCVRIACVFFTMPVPEQGFFSSSASIWHCHSELDSDKRHTLVSHTLITTQVTHRPGNDWHEMETSLIPPARELSRNNN